MWIWVLALSVMLCAALLTPACSLHAKAYENSVGLANGLYAAEGFGANYYLGLRYTHFFDNWHYFVEGTLGFSSLSSPVLNDLAAFQVFDSQKLWAYEFLFGYDMRPLYGLPYVLAGVAAVNQGGQSKFSYVIGVGKQIPLVQFFNVKRLGIRYDIRDHIFRQQINENEPFTAHNLVVTVGLQYYF